jgi:nucleoside-diphosphate-sugar epimerase
MIVVTGGAGFVGSNLVRALNAEGERIFEIFVTVDLATSWSRRISQERLVVASLTA